MIKIYKRALQVSTDKWFGRENRKWILQKINDPKHRNRIARNRKSKTALKNRIDHHSHHT